jgi:predicted cupin superfamily sugar epimerase
MPNTAREWIERLALTEHPEGGWYQEIYRSDDQVLLTATPKTVSKPRAAMTSIYFLLEAPEVSCLHRIDSDELWYWHAGDELRIEVIAPQGTRRTLRLGPEASLQVAVEKGCWFGAELPSSQGWALVSCAVAPGFEFSGFELAERSSLLASYPEHRELILRLTRLMNAE